MSDHLHRNQDGQTAGPVPSERRFNRRNPCPVCGGHAGQRRGSGIRCYGFLGGDGRHAYCTREEFARDLPLSPDSGTYAHILDGPCSCGVVHAAPAPRSPLTRAGRPREFKDADFQDATVFDYLDEAGTIRIRIARRRRGTQKDLKAYRPAGDGIWLLGVAEIPRILYRLPELRAGISRGEPVYVVEGEKKVEMLRQLGLTATTNPFGAGKWLASFNASLEGASRIVVIADNDAKGREHAEAVAHALRGAGLRDVHRVVPPVEEGQGIDDWLTQATRTRADVERLSPPHCVDAPDAGRRVPGKPWAAAVDVHDFVNALDPQADFLEPRMIARGAVTSWNSPRGIGKTLAAHHLAVSLARRGLRVLLLDRDNPRREVRRRLVAWGLDELQAGRLKVISREDAPPLTNAAAWREFPVGEYDLLILDSFGSASEGVGEQDSAKPSLAVAALLDVVRATRGPAALVLDNTTKSGAHGRGSGVIEDRFDITFEVRDATRFTPTGAKDWWEELPASGRGNWADRASRRKRRQQYRLAFVPTKFRVGEEPDPFVLEVSCAQEPWTCTDVTDAMALDGLQVQADAREAELARAETAAAALRDEVARCAALGEPMAKGKGAEDFLGGLGIPREAARHLIAARVGQDWAVVGSGTRGDRTRLVPLIGTRSQVASARIERPREVRGTHAELGRTLAEQAPRPRRESSPGGSAPIEAGTNGSSSPPDLIGILAQTLDLELMGSDVPFPSEREHEEVQAHLHRCQELHGECSQGRGDHAAPAPLSGNEPPGDVETDDGA